MLLKYGCIIICCVVDARVHQNPMSFLGRRDCTKEDVNMLVYKDDIEECSAKGEGGG